MFYLYSEIGWPLNITWPSLGDLIRSLGTAIVRFVFWILTSLYDLFMNVANVQILTQENIKPIYNKVTLVLTIVMIFYVTFHTIKYVIDPDKMVDKEQGGGKIVVRMILVVVLLAMVPTIFEFAYKTQGRILKSGLIEKVINANTTVVDTSNYGYSFAGDLLNVFYYVKDGRGSKNCKVPSGGLSATKCKDVVNANIDELRSTGSMSNLAQGIWDPDDGDYHIGFDWLLAVIVGGFICYMLLLYTIDAGARVVQLAFLQMIAPIPIIGYLSPKKDNMFDKWVKQCVTTYIDLFIRLTIIYVVLLISQILGTALNAGTLINNTNAAHGSTMEKFIYLALIIGLFLFAQRAPKMIQELMPGLGSKAAAGDFGLNASKKVAPGAARTIGAAWGAAKGAKRGVAGLGNKLRKRKQTKDDLRSQGIDPTRRNLKNARRTAKDKYKADKGELADARRELRSAIKSGDQNRIRQAQNNFNQKRKDAIVSENALAEKKGQMLKMGSVGGIIGSTIGSTIAGTTRGTWEGGKAKKIEEIRKQGAAVDKINVEKIQARENYIESGGTSMVDKWISKKEQSWGITTKAQAMEREVKAMEANVKAQEATVNAEQAIVKKNDEALNAIKGKLSEGKLKTTAATTENLDFSVGGVSRTVTVAAGQKYADVLRNEKTLADQAAEELKLAQASGDTARIENATKQNNLHQTIVAQLEKELSKKAESQIFKAVSDNREKIARGEAPDSYNPDFESGAVTAVEGLFEIINDARLNPTIVAHMRDYLGADSDVFKAFIGELPIDSFDVYDNVEKAIKHVSGSLGNDVSSLKTMQNLISTGAAYDAAKAADAASGGGKK